MTACYTDHSLPLTKFTLNEEAVIQELVKYTACPTALKYWKMY